jgi:carbamoyl-phosphate synthase large subunit
MMGEAMRILITGAGGPSAISVWKSLKEDHELYMADMDARAAGLYLVPPDRRFLLPRGDSPQFVEVVAAECKKRAIDLLIPTVDSELLPIARARQGLVQAGTKVQLCSSEVLEVCRDKYALLRHCSGEEYVPQFTLLSEDNVGMLTKFPLFAKPRFGAGSVGLHYIESEEELLALPRDNSYLVQEHLPGEEYSVDVYVKSDGKVIAAVPRLRMKTDSGIAVTARTVQQKDAIELAHRVIEKVGIRYAANIQFKRAADGRLMLLEVNPRFPGTLPLTNAAGIDLPKLLLREAAGEAMPDKLLPFIECMVVRYWTEHFLKVEEWEQLCTPTHG